MLILGFSGAIWEYSSPRIIGLYLAFGIIVIAFQCQQWLGVFTSNPIFPVHFGEGGVYNSISSDLDCDLRYRRYDVYVDYSFSVYTVIQRFTLDSTSLR